MILFRDESGAVILPPLLISSVLFLPASVIHFHASQKHLILTPLYCLCSWFPLSPGSLGRELVVLHLVLQRNQGSDGIKQWKAFGLIYYQLQVADQDRNVHGSVKGREEWFKQDLVEHMQIGGLHYNSTKSLRIKRPFPKLQPVQYTESLLFSHYLIFSIKVNERS